LRNAGLPVNLVALRQARNKAAQSKFVFQATVLDTVRQTELAYWELVLANEVLKIREFAVKLAEEQLKRNEDLLAVGKAIEGDVMAARAERASRMADLADAQAAIRTQTIGLVRLLNPAAARQWTLTFEPTDPPDAVQTPLDAGASEQLAVQYRPELAQARLDLANSDLDVLKAKNGLLPEVDLVSSYGKTAGSTGASGTTSSGTGGGGSESYQVGIQLQTPLFYRAERARRQRAVLTRDQAERSVANLEQSIGAGVRQAAVEVERQWERTGATEEAMKNRTEQLRVAQGRYEVGKTTNLDLLLVQRDVIQTRVDGVTARAKYIEALTSLYAAEGTLLERRGISLEEKNEKT
jgi:outer membrane protein TolC